MVNSVKKSIEILNCFTSDQLEIGITELSKKLNMNKSTLHHIVKSLSDEGILIRTKDRKYRLGTKLLLWGDLVSAQYKHYFNTLPYIEELVKKTNETVHLAIRENDKATYLLKVEPKVTVKIKTSMGARRPIYCTGVGKVLLAADEKKNQIKDIPLEAFTKNTVTDHDELLDELNTIKRNGFAIDREEYEEGLMCLAAPVKDISGDVVCAISISGPEVRLSENKNTLTDHLLTVTHKISKNSILY
ncbi:transcriptional regulator, IclR family [Alteribacillus persepolensis]|uniref:Transcriptional regulator, IclR family n=1 Tax=Alteribacillus persepolensis TaxID=568899 RepID=A0A1G8JC78_9BACI|nr:IclR family transcriptional regulator [Alteribacillus persepolensis]SDI28835.1 transcriptional regulator, IclR family [Alteribacillus persepolensis]